MSVVLLVARAEARRRRAALVGLALIVALVGTAVLGSAMGARRTATALDRFREATAARDADLYVTAYGATEGDALVDRVLGLDGVEEVGGVASVFIAASFTNDVVVLAPLDDVAFERIDRPLLLDGRRPAPGAAAEVVVSESAAELLGVGTGDRLEVDTFSLDDCEALARDDFQGVNGPAIELEVVGEVRLVDELPDGRLGDAHAFVAGPSFIGAHGDACAATIVAQLRYGDGGGPTTEQLQALTREVDGASSGESGAATLEDEIVDELDAAVRVALVALVGFALVALLAGALAVVQAISRLLELDEDEALVLRGLGLSPLRRRLARALPAVMAATGGALVGAAGAVALSPLFPMSAASRAEPDPGVEVNLAVLAVGVVGAAALAVLLAAWATRPRPGGVRPRSSVWSRLAARAGRPTLVVGARLVGGGGRAQAPVRTALVGSTVAVAGVCAVLVLGTSLDDTLDRPERYGWAWSVQPDFDVPDPEATVLDLAEEEGIAALGRLDQGVVEVDGVAVDASAVDVRTGTVDFEVIEGRAPVADDEIALGVDDLGDLEVGDVVAVAGPAGDPRDHTVVGRVVLPQADGRALPGVHLTAPGLAAVSDQLRYSLLLTYEPGVDVEALEARLGPEYSLTFPVYARPSPPARLAALDEIRGVFVAVALFFGLLGLAGLTHAVIAATERDRGLLTALWSFGFRRRQVVGSVVLCAAAIVTLAVLVAVPLGLVVGRLGWRAAVDGIGILVSPASPAGSVAAVGVAAVGLAVLTGAPRAWRTARHLSAAQLRAE